MRAARWLGPERLELTVLEAPAAGRGQAVVEVAACGICGSDLHSYQHGFAARPGQVLGHEFAGRIVEGGGLETGTRVCIRPLIPCGHCERCRAGEIQLCEGGFGDQIGYAARGAFAERVLVPRAQVGETVFVLPDAVDDEAGALVEPLAVGLHAVRLGQPQAGDTAVVFGLGTIGLGVVAFLRLAGVRTILAFDPSALRRERALELGADAVHDPAAAVEAVRTVTGSGPFGGARADLAVECAGVGQAFTDATRILRNGGRLVLAAIYGRAFEVNPGRIVEKELTVRGSFAYNDEFGRVIDLLANGAIDASRFISHRFPLERIEDAFRMQLDRERSLKVLVTPQAW
jgi:(R,R)-butanediol dehydrogenase/meso-butanediol dehydrogenase/diacetyl reductase